MKPMSTSEQEAERRRFSHVAEATNLLRAASSDDAFADDDLRVALARLDNWIAENEGRWVA